MQPVDGVEVLAVAVAELDGELGLADAAGAGEGSGLGDCGWAVLGCIEQVVGEGKQLFDTTGEGVVGVEGQVRAGREDGTRR